MTTTDIANFALAKLGAEQIASLNATGVKEAIHARLHFEAARNEVLRDHPWGFANQTALLAFSSPASAATDLWAMTPETPDTWRKFTAAELAGVYTYTATTADLFALVEVTLEDGTTEDRWGWFATDDAVYPMAQARDAATHPAAVTVWLDCVTYAAVTIAFKNAEKGLWSYSYELPADCVRLRWMEQADGRHVDRFARGLVYSKQAVLTHTGPDLWLTYTAKVSDPTQFDPLFTNAFATLLAAKLARAITGSDTLEAQLLAIYRNDALGEARFRDAQETESGENRDGIAEISAGDLLGRRGMGLGAAARSASVTIPGTGAGSIAVPDLDGEFESYL